MFCDKSWIAVWGITGKPKILHKQNNQFVVVEFNLILSLFLCLPLFFPMFLFRPFCISPLVPTHKNTHTGSFL